MDYYTPQEFNNAELVGTHEPNSPAWLELRKTGIGGSDIGTICGLNPWESAYTLWAKRAGHIPEEKLNSWAVRLGQAFEDPILELYQEEHPEKIIYKTGTYRHKEHPIMLANPDALAYNEDTDEWMIIEVKTARYEWDSIPQHYIAQVQHYLYVMGLDLAVICGVQGMAWHEYVIRADKFEQENQLMMAQKFWKTVQDDTKPAWDGSESTYQTVRKMNPEVGDDTVDIGELGLVLWTAQRRLEEAQAELNTAKSAALDAMGKARHATMELEGQEYRVASRHMRGDAPVLVVKK